MTKKTVIEGIKDGDIVVGPCSCGLNNSLEKRISVLTSQRTAEMARAEAYKEVVHMLIKELTNANP